MNPKYRKIYCCTPVAFHANDGFWIRDTGLISRSLQQMGVESKCIMPLPYYDDDQKEGLIRTEYKNLKSAAWWKSLGIDALVLYSWGAPRYLPIARAVRKAGITLMIHMDTSGDFATRPRKGESWFKNMCRRLRNKAVNYYRAKHLQQASILTMGPTVADAIAEQPFYGKWIQEKLFPMACPVKPDMRYENKPKEDTILCIGRWQDEAQKRPEFMIQTLAHYYATGGTATTKIFGNIPQKLKDLHSNLPTEIAARIQLCGYIPNRELKGEYKRAKVILCASAYEGSHNVSAEALCCGCAVVTANKPAELRNLLWYASKNSGTVSAADTPDSLAQALHRELNAWATGNRCPQAIAEAWHPHFHVDKVFNKIFQ